MPRRVAKGREGGKARDKFGVALEQVPPKISGIIALHKRIRGGVASGVLQLGPLHAHPGVPELFQVPGVVEVQGTEDDLAHRFRADPDAAELLQQAVLGQHNGRRQGQTPRTRSAPLRP